MNRRGFIKFASIMSASLLIAKDDVLSPLQKARIRMVMRVAKKIFKYKTTMGAIYLVESSAGANKNKIGDDNKSFGEMQIQVPTVRQVALWFPEQFGWTEKLDEVDIQNLLLVNLEFSVRIACYYVKRFLDCGWTYEKSVMMYNGFWEVDVNGKAIRDKYGNKVMNYQYVNKVNLNKKLILREM